MHAANVLQAWIITAYDELTAGLEANGLSLRELAALTLIAEHPGCSTDWLYPRVGLTQSGAVRLLDRLVERELVARSRPAGGRGGALSVTRRGAAARRKGLAVGDRVLDGLLQPLSAEERTALTALLDTSLRARSAARLDADRSCRTCNWRLCVPDCPVDASVWTAG
jgi:DNA-binding MarR family transcriptional regulator